MRRSGISLEPGSAGQFMPSRDSLTRPECLSLRDGRMFLTREERLVSGIREAAASRLPVLIEGETGTGKELVAHLIHELGPAAQRPFVVVDCATLVESLAEAELFGTARGAYTGAVLDRQGLIEAADGGTLFIDELPELSAALQAKLLRVLQEGTYRRVGETHARVIRARVIAATNRDAEKLLGAGLLRPDLFFRLNGHRLRLGALRDRPDDIAELANHVARAEGFLGIADAALVMLKSFSWPGNVRQLEMIVRLAASRHRGALCLSSFSFGSDGARVAMPSPGTLRDRRLEAERETLKRTLDHHRGNVSAAARSLAISRQGFYKAMRRVGLT